MKFGIIVDEFGNYLLTKKCKQPTPPNAKHPAKDLTKNVRVCTDLTGINHQTQVAKLFMFCQAPKWGGSGVTPLDSFKYGWIQADR